MPSLYEATAATGDVSSSDFTTLYNASGLTVPNAGAGAVTGNLNVSGNLTVQGTSNLIGAVTIGNTLSTPNYTFPLPDGSTDQVLVTDGNGNLYWTDVTAIPGAAYQIEANTTTGGANLTLVDSAGGTDSVKFASGTNITVSRTSANTITISSSADDIPDGTANGQVLVWENSAWTASNIVSANAITDRLVAEFKDNTTTTNSSFALRRNTGSTPYASATSASLIAQVDSDSQALASYAALGFGYDASNPTFGIRTSTNNFSTSTQILSADSTELVINGTNITLNSNLTGAPTSNATITVNRGSSTDAVITWDETDDRWELNNDLLATGLQGGNIQIAMSGSLDNQIYIGGDNLLLDTDGSHVVQSNSPIQTSAESMSINSDSTATNSQLNFKGTTQYIKWNNASNRFELSNALQVGGDATVLGNYSQTGESMTINSDSTAADSYLYMKGATEYLKWNNANTRFEFSDQLFNSQTDIPVYLERQVTTADVDPRESANTLQLVERVTDAGSNDTDDAGPSISFGRTFGTSPSSSMVKFANIGANYFGTTNTAEFLFNWSNDNYTPNPAHTYPGTYNLLRLGSNDSNFLNNSIFVNYSAQGTDTDTATSITGGNTLVFGSAHGYTAGQRIKFTSTTQNGLTQNAYYYVLSSGLTTTQCQLGLTVSSSPVALTNGTGLTLVFANLVNFVGINTGSPAYTLDVTGDIRATGDVITGGITAGNITVGVVTDNTISTTSGDLTITPATSSTVNIASVVSTDPVTITRVTTVTNSATRGLTLRANSTGTPAVGIGVGLDFEVETASSTFTSGGNINVVATDITPASEDFKMNFSLTANGTQSVVATLDNTGTLDLDGDIQVNGNDIKSSTGFTAISLDNNSIVVQGDITVNGQEIKSNGGTTVITLGGNNATFAGDIEVQGQEIKSNGGTTAITLNGADIGTGDITLNGGDIRSSGGTVAISVSGADMSTGDITLNGGDIRSSGGTVAISVSGADATVAGDLTVNGGDITLNASATTTSIQMGSLSTQATSQVTTSATGATAIMTTTRNVMKVLVNVYDTITGAFHTVECLVLRNGATAMLTTYAELYTSAALAAFTADVSGGAIRLLANPVSSNTTNFNCVRTSLN